MPGATSCRIAFGAIPCWPSFEKFGGGGTGASLSPEASGAMPRHMSMRAASACKIVAFGPAGSTASSASKSRYMATKCWITTGSDSATIWS